MNSETLRFRILEADMRAQQRRGDEYRELLLALVEESTSTSLSTVFAASSLLFVAYTSLRSSRLAEIIPSPSPRPSPYEGPRRYPLSVTGAPAQLRPVWTARIYLDRPAPYRRAESVRDHGGVARREHRVSASPGPTTPQPTVRRLTRSQQALTTSSPNEGHWATSSHAPTISTSSSTHENEVADDVPDAPNAIREILDCAGLSAYSLSWGESERANMTPRIRRPTITKVFGGDARREWFECNLKPNYKYFFCADLGTQPFVPTRVGDRGLVLIGPAWDDETQDEEGHIFHAFVSADASKSGRMNYVGDYTKVPLLQTN
ncbi:hypothetical protein H4582DRAFT_1909730, partial [Lactarius indigo]